MPDLILMDGGELEMNAVKDVLENELNLHIPVAGMVKNDKHRTARLLYGDLDQPIDLDPHSQGFYLLTRIQDEVHRFAITFHRQLRNKNSLASKLEMIQGVGPRRARNCCASSRPLITSKKPVSRTLKSSASARKWPRRSRYRCRPVSRPAVVGFFRGFGATKAAHASVNRIMNMAVDTLIVNGNQEVEQMKWGIMGLGKIARDFAAQINETRPVYGVASRDPARTAQFAAAFQVEHQYASYQEMAADPHIDCIYIATVNSQHLKDIRLCLEAGKNVLCEKAIWRNYAETKAMYDLARQKHLILAEAMTIYHMPLYRQLRQLIEAGRSVSSR